MRKNLFVMLAAAVALAACSGQNNAASSPAPAATKAVDNGRLIFLTGKDARGFHIMAASPPLRPSCAACHRANGAGGLHIRGAVSADLRRKAMSEGDHPYTLELVERAISTGVDNEGKPLDPVMPRWRLSAQDLHDVAAYVMALK